MSHYVSEVLARERIADWHREAGRERMARANAAPRFASWPAQQDRRTDPHGPVAAASHGPIGRLSGWLGQVRMLAQRLAIRA